MASDPAWPPMRHSAAYYNHRNRSSFATAFATAHPQHLYPPLSSLSRPREAHVNPHPRTFLLDPRTEPSRLQSSVSSGESDSSSNSDYKSYLQSKSYQFGPTVERDLMEELTTREADQESQVRNEVCRSDVEPPEMIEDNSAIFRYIHEGRVEDDKENDHALWILFWMSLLDPVWCLFSALFTVFAVLATTFLLPLQICRRDCSPSIYLVRMSAPIFQSHLQMIFAKSREDVHAFDLSPLCLVFIQLVSPILSIPNAAAAWVVAVFWVFVIIMGNPDGTEKRDDGRAAVIMLRDWWEKCLLYAVRQ